MSIGIDDSVIIPISHFKCLEVLRRFSLGSMAGLGDGFDKVNLVNV